MGVSMLTDHDYDRASCLWDTMNLHGCFSSKWTNAKRMASEYDVVGRFDVPVTTHSLRRRGRGVKRKVGKG